MKKKEVLIIDDDKSLGVSLKKILSKTGLSVEHAISGNKAREFLKKDDYLVSILDIKLPDVNGLELLSELKKKYPNIEFIMVTAYASLDKTILAINEAAFAFVEKPFEIPYLESLIRDAMAKHRLKLELIESEEKYRVLYEKFRTLVSNIPGAVYRAIADEHWTVEFLSDAIKDISGFPASDFIQNKVRSYASIIHPDDGELVEKTVYSAIDKGEPYFIEYRIINSNGEVVWVHEKGRGIVREDGEILWLDGAIFDITEKKKAEEIIKEQNEFLINVIESLTYPFYVININDYKIELMNSAANIDISSNGLTCYELTHKLGEPCSGEISCPLEKVIKTKKPCIVEHRHYDNKGNLKDFEVHGYPIFNKDGDIIQMIECTLDITERKIAEEVLQLEQDNLTNILNSMVDGVYKVNQQYDIEYINPTLISEFGPIEDRKCYNYFHDYYESCPWCKNQDVFKGKTVRWEWFSEKNQRTYDLIDTPMKNSDGSISKLEIFRDITERKKAEDKLRENEERIRTLVFNIPGAVYRAAADKYRTVELISGAIKDISGFPASDFIQNKVRSYASIIHPDDGELVEKTVYSAIDKGEPYIIEYRIINSNGEVVWVYEKGQGIVREDGEILWLDGAIFDITEKKQMELNLIKSEEKYRLITENANDLIFVINTRSKFEYLNEPAFKRVMGYSSEELIGIKSTKLIHPDDLEEVNNVLFKSFKSGQGSTINRMKHKDGHYIWLEIEGKVFVGIDGKNKTLMIARDITERKKAEEELKKYRDHLEELVKDRTQTLEQTLSALKRSNEDLEQFAYVASHDLREPLRTITSFTQLLSKRYKDKLDDEANEFIRFSVEGAQRMNELISDLLTYSRVGTQGKSFELTDCEELLGKVILNLQAFIQERGAKITYKNLPTVMVDSSQFIQLLQNLIGNAIKFHGEKPPRIHISTKQEDNKWVFSVKDNGIGIDPKYFKQIFEIFKRLHTREEYSGSGIGLAICKKIVERYGGNIWVESEVGKGSTFYFTI